jgi:hypothetical protein
VPRGYLELLGGDEVPVEVHVLVHRHRLRLLGREGQGRGLHGQGMRRGRHSCHCSPNLAGGGGQGGGDKAAVGGRSRVKAKCMEIRYRKGRCVAPKSVPGNISRARHSDELGTETGCRAETQRLWNGPDRHAIIDPN